MDLVASHPIPERVREPLRAALRGETLPWPQPLHTDELRSLIAHGVVPLVYSVVALPDLRHEAIRSAAVEQLRLDDLRGVLAVLSRAGVESLVVKGSGLAYDIYDPAELRPRADTDLLVSPRSVVPMRQAMLAAGFRELPGSGDEHGVRQTLFTRRDARGIEHAYDAHWDVSNAPAFSAALSFDEARSRAIRLSRIGPDAWGLCRADALLLACIHRVSHHHDSERLIWLADIAFLRSRMTEAEHTRFWKTASDRRVLGACVRSIELADEWMSRPPAHGPEAYLTASELARPEPSRAFLDPDIRYGGVLLANFRALPWRARLERLRHLAFPPAAFMRSEPGSGNAPLAWLYAKRGVRGIRRLFTRAASTRS